MLIFGVIRIHVTYKMNNLKKEKKRSIITYMKTKNNS
jgi:hypothetical protein